MARTKQSARKSTGRRRPGKLVVNRNNDTEKTSYTPSTSELATAHGLPVPAASTAVSKFEDIHPLVAAFNTLEIPLGPASHHSPPKTEYTYPRTPTSSIRGRNTQKARKSTGGRRPSQSQENTYSSHSHPVISTPGSSSSTAQPLNTGVADSDTGRHGTLRRMKQTARKSTGGKQREQ
ncbi:hypothetical protein F5146DRAFT_1022872 [Armillaria mellea]|nr:hypothetical protein F5146DRAFT_1022872 [Armillaria mellea]